MSVCLYRFGPFDLDPDKRLFVRAGVAVPLGPKVIETLAVLVERAGSLVTKNELMGRLWPDRFVEEANLTQNIYRLRRVLTSAGLAGAIETMNCRGYRFVVPVEHIEGSTALRGAAAKAATPIAVTPVAATPIAAAPNVVASTAAAPRRRWVGAALAAASCVLMLVTPGVSHPHISRAYDRLSPESKRSYSVGPYDWNLRSDAARVKQSMRYFQDVVKRDPGNPLGYSGLADGYLSIFDLDCDSMIANCHRVVSLATENARRAVALDPESAEAHTSLAMAIYEFTDQDGRAEAEFQRAIALDPNYALAHHWYGNFLLVRGQIAQANVQQQEALALEPVSPATYAWLAEDAYFTRSYRDAIAYAQQSLAIFPHRHATVALLGLAYEQSGETRSAMTTFAQLPRVEREALTAALYARIGDRARALATLHAIAPKEAFGSGCTIQLALAWAALGDKDRAFAFLRATPPPNRVEHNFYAFDPRLDALRTDARFKAWTQPE